MQGCRRHRRAWSILTTAGCASASRRARRRTATRQSGKSPGLQCILFQYPDATKASYDLDTQLEIATQPGVVATKNGVRNMKRWYVEIPELKKANPGPAGSELP